jgi:hypothetical protein
MTFAQQPPAPTPQLAGIGGAAGPGAHGADRPGRTV